jgi:hypothetical protein
LVVGDELGLAAFSFQRHHRHAGRVGGDCRAVVAADHVQAHVEAGRRARRGEELAVVDVEHVRVDCHTRVAGRQLGGGHPVGGRTQPVEKAGRREDERTGTD